MPVVSAAQLLAHFETVDPVMGARGRAARPYTHAATPPPAVYESLARSIAGQQLSGAVARRILERLEALFKGTFPTPAQLAAADVTTLRSVGFSQAKAIALQDLAAHCLDGRLADDATLATVDDETVIEHCCSVRGIGRWTAQMLLMSQLQRPDVLPVGDYGVCNGFKLAYGLKALPQPKALAAWGKRWSPYRSAAAWYLWRAVDLHRAAQLPARSGRAPRVLQVKPKAPKP